MPSVMWTRTDGRGMDRATLQSSPGGHRIGGTAILSIDGTPYEIRYSVLTDELWRTTTVGAHAQMPDGDRRLALSADGTGSWFVGDDPILDLFGAIDVDLGWTPVTNTVAIRRLGLSVGEEQEITVARIDFPSHEIERVTQRYRRLDEAHYRYSSRDLAVEFEVDEHGLIIDYPDGWKRIATSV